jgi:hypothetical protein
MNLINRKAVRRLFLEEAGKWNSAKKRRRVSADVIKNLEAAFHRLVIAHASQDFAGRSKGA